jgi:hypothetical protein
LDDDGGRSPSSGTCHTTAMGHWHGNGGGGREKEEVARRHSVAGHRAESKMWVRASDREGEDGIGAKEDVDQP